MTNHIAFEDFDNINVFRKALSHAKSFKSRNFILDFDSTKARYAPDVDEDGFRSLLAESRSPPGSGSRPPTRWINVWKPETQKTALQLLGKHYGFSPRLLASMVSSPRTTAPAPRSEPHHRNYQELYQDLRNKATRTRRSRLMVPNTATHATGSDVESIDMPGTPAYSHMTLDINHYRIVDEVWHFASIDWGHRFTCIGYNSLYQMRDQPVIDAQVFEGNKPAGKRVWAWLIICDDNTVISIHEDPYPNAAGRTQLELLTIRHNLLNVFKQLSKAAEDGHAPNPIMLVHIRPGLQNAEKGETHITEDDSASLLFYYLFDDWFTTYSLVARSEHQYGSHLERTRENMFRVADLNNIKHLHHFGRQLAVLKRIYQSYVMLIERILRGPQASPSRHAVQEAGRSIDDSALSIDSVGPEYGMKVTTAAAVRFERLRDRINLYALGEIQDCLEEKDSLVMINFNLIALRESSYVERLTRITILLAKVTILFIPVSLMSTYFTVPINGLNASGEGYSLAAYWVSFAVIFFISLIVLVVFGQVSGTQEGKPVYQSLTKAAFYSWKAFLGRRRNRVEEKDVGR